MKYKVRQGNRCIVVESTEKVEVHCNGTVKEVEALAFLQAPQLASAIAANDAEKQAIHEVYRKELEDLEEQVDQLKNRLGMMAIVFKEMTMQCQFDRHGDRWKLMYATRLPNEQLELAYNMAMQVDIEQEFQRLMKRMTEEEL